MAVNDVPDFTDVVQAVSTLPGTSGLVSINADTGSIPAGNTANVISAVAGKTIRVYAIVGSFFSGGAGQAIMHLRGGTSLIDVMSMAASVQTMVGQIAVPLGPLVLPSGLPLQVGESLAVNNGSPTQAITVQATIYYTQL